MNEPTSVPHVEQVAPAGASQSAAAPNGPSALAIDILRRTRPWTMFLAILGFIGAGFMVIATIAMVVGAVVGASGFGGAGEVGMVLGMAVAYALFTVAYFFVSMALFRYGRSIGALLHTGGAAALEDALDAQRRFWKLFGIIVIATMALMTLVFIVGIVAALALGASGF